MEHRYEQPLGGLYGHCKRSAQFRGTLACRSEGVISGSPKKRGEDRNGCEGVLGKNGLKKMGYKEKYRLKCFNCKEWSDERVSCTVCRKCGGQLEVKYDYDLIAENLNVHVLKSAPMKATKYLDFYPLSNLKNVVSLNEGGTPLYRSKKLEKELKVKRLWLKFEGLNPTGGFKDRGTLVEITKALELGAKTVTCASTGNMAASVSAYASMADMPCYIVIPEGTPLGKMAQTLAFGARVVQVRGTYDDAAKLVLEMSERHKLYLAGDYAFRLEGQKSQAYEIIEQLGWRSPDKVVVPVGNGTNASAIWKGFKEFELLGLMDGLPQLVGVQPQSVSPIAQAFRTGGPIIPVEHPETVASAVCVGNPSDASKLMAALNESGGNTAIATDKEILEAEKLLAKSESMFVEPSAALSLAGYRNMLDSGEVGRDEEIVLVLTGTGLKDPLSALRVLPSPPTVEPTLEEVQKFLDHDYYKLSIDVNGNSEHALITRKVTEEEIGNMVKREFDLVLAASDVRFCLHEVGDFLRKGKSVHKNDLKLIIEEALQRGNLKEKALEVVDFEVNTSKNGKPSAVAIVKLGNRNLERRAEGVGPVDAVINAIKAAVEGQMKFALTDYKVEINTKNTDATVDVRLTLQDENHNKVIAMGTSPDIIVASIKAFEEGYNILHAKNRAKQK